MKFFKKFLSCFLPLILTGCSVEINVDTMLTPPKLSGEQEQIYQALQEAAGSDIRLKYPKSGSYLSAFIIADIDEESGEESGEEPSGEPSGDEPGDELDEELPGESSEEPDEEFGE